MTTFCIVCGGDHKPNSSICDSEGMDRQITRLGAKRWNAMTAHVSRAINKEARAMLDAATKDGERG